MYGTLPKCFLPHSLVFHHERKHWVVYFILSTLSLCYSCSQCISDYLGLKKMHEMISINMHACKQAQVSLEKF